MRTLNKLERQIIELDRRITDRRFKTYKGPRSQIVHLNPIAPNYSKIGKTLRAIWAIWISIMAAWAYRLKFKEPPKSKRTLHLIGNNPTRLMILGRLRRIWTGSISRGPHSWKWRTLSNLLILVPNFIKQKDQISRMNRTSLKWIRANRQYLF